LSTILFAATQGCDPEYTKLIPSIMQG